MARETDNLHLQAWTLRALATIAADEAVSDDVMQEYREVTELTERSGDRGGHVWSLATYADAERLRGELDRAHSTCEQSNAEAAALSDPQFAVYSGFTCWSRSIGTKPLPCGLRCRRSCARLRPWATRRT